MSNDIPKTGMTEVEIELEADKILEEAGASYLYQTKEKIMALAKRYKGGCVMSKIDRKIDCDTAELATPAEPKKAKKWRNMYRRMGTGKIYYGSKIHDTREKALAGFNAWMQESISIVKRGLIPVSNKMGEKDLPCLELEYLGPVEVEP
jgi:hypothetical protein